MYRRLARHIEALPKEKHTSSKTLNLLAKGDLIGNLWISKDGDIYRLFYLVGEQSSEIWWKSNTNTDSAISTDLENWQSLGTAIAPKLGNAWESGKVLTDSTYKVGITD